MHMPKRIELAAPPDPEILTRISESDVTLWIAAKLHQIREQTKLPIYYMDLEVWARSNRDNPYDMNWSMHAPDVCALTHDTIESAVAEVRETLLGDPKAKAEKKRWEAKSLLEEAEHLEKLSKGVSE